VAEPAPERLELADVFFPAQVLAAILSAQGAIGGDREAEVRTVDLFLEHELVGEKLFELVGREHLVVARLALAEPNEVRRARQPEELARAHLLVVLLLDRVLAQ